MCAPKEKSGLGFCDLKAFNFGPFGEIRLTATNMYKLLGLQGL